jgi:rRNA maturation protein Nop10
MTKDLDVIKKYTLKVTYICPVTGEEITLTSEPDTTEFEVEDNGGQWPSNINISVGKCKSCGRYHDSFELQQH